MSLLNDVLCDLQKRGAFGMEPLSGLVPVAETPAQRSRYALLLPLLATVAVAALILIWQPIANTIAGNPWKPASATVMIPADAPPAVVLPVPAAAMPEPGAALSQNYSPVVIDRQDDPQPALPKDDAVVAAVEPPPVTSKAPVAALPAVEDYSPAASVAPPTTSISRRIEDHRTGPEQTAAARGLQALRGGNLSAAEHFFKAAIAADAGDGTLWSYLYSTQIQASKIAAAEQSLRRGLTTAREPAPLAKLYARLLLDRGEIGAAVTVLSDYRSATPGDAEYDAFLAALLRQQGQFEQAGALYRQLLARDPGPGDWWIGLAMSYDSLGNHADALATFQRGLRAHTLKPPLARYARRRVAELQAND